MFGIGMSEMILICALALIVVGPDKLPELARSIAKGVMELKKAASGLKESLNDEIAPTLDIVKPELEEASKALHENFEHQKRLTTEETPKAVDTEPDSSSNANNPSDTENATDTAKDTSDEADDNTNPSMSTDELIARAQQSKTNSQEEHKDA